GIRAGHVTGVQTCALPILVIELTDRTTVMKDARVVATCPTAELDKQQMMNLIVGRALEEMFPEQGEPLSAEPLVRVRGLSRGREIGRASCRERVRDAGVAL